MCFLNFQIEHHLFPTMPQFRFRDDKFRSKVQALANKHSLPYISLSYWDALKKTFANLNHVSNQLQNDCEENVCKNE